MDRMDLLAIGLMILAALGAWLFRSRRVDALLVLSVLALYLLQPGTLKSVLPLATLLLVVGVWWITNPEPTLQDWKTLLLVGATAAILPLASTLAGAALREWLWTLPVVAAFVCGTVAAGSLVPARDDEARRRLALAFMVLIVLLFVIIKMPALQGAAAASLSRADLPVALDWQWLGFSYIAFRLLHVLIDYRNKRLPVITLRDFALYVVFYPALPAGPIDRAERFVRELQQPTALDSERVINGATRIGIGLFKKFVMADMLAFIALKPQLVAQTATLHDFSSTWIMVYAYAWQIFFDFSGYTDIAIGIGILAGIKLPENFTAPYTKRNISAFWNS
jgi:alginate O-acetyltransferase complex protein AlgI